MASILIIVLALAAIAETFMYSTTSDCFILEGFATNGTSFGFLLVGTIGPALPPLLGIFVASRADATKFGIEASTGHLIDRNKGLALGGSSEIPHNGLTATVIQSGGYSDWIQFETLQALQDQETQPSRVAIRCQLNRRDRFTCVHPNITNYNVFQYCAPIDVLWGWSDLKLGVGIDPPSQIFCKAVSLIAIAARGCSA